MLMAAIILPVGARSSVDVYTRLYRRVPTMDQKIAVMQKIVQMDNKEFELLLLDALEELVIGEYSNYATGETMSSYEALTKMVVRELGELKAIDAADLVYQVSRTQKDPLLISEALISLGNMRALDYADEIAIKLRNINFNTRKDKDAAEKEAYGCIIALEKMKDLQGFEPIFYAHIGWFSRRVKKQAESSMYNIADDPTTAIINIMQNTEKFKDKKIAVNVEAQSNATPENKGKVALTGLQEGLKYAASSKDEELQLTELRKVSINIFIQTEAKNSDTVVPLDKSIDHTNDIDEKLMAIQALGINGSDEAVTALGLRLSEYNSRQMGGIAANNTELRIIKQLIYALGISANQLALPALSEVEFSDYTPAINRGAKESIQKIEG